MLFPRRRFMHIRRPTLRAAYLPTACLSLGDTRIVPTRAVHTVHVLHRMTYMWHSPALHASHMCRQLYHLTVGPRPMHLTVAYAYASIKYESQQVKQCRAVGPTQPSQSQSYVICFAVPFSKPRKPSCNFHRSRAGLATSSMCRPRDQPQSRV